MTLVIVSDVSVPKRCPPCESALVMIAQCCRDCSYSACADSVAGTADELVACAFEIIEHVVHA